MRRFLAKPYFAFLGSLREYRTGTEPCGPSNLSCLYRRSLKGSADSFGLAPNRARSAIPVMASDGLYRYEEVLENLDFIAPGPKAAGQECRDERI